MIEKVFPSSVYVEPLMKSESQLKKFVVEIRRDLEKIQEYDLEGKEWSAENYPGGYTSYSSLSELHQFSSTFAELQQRLDGHVKKYARSLDIDLKQCELAMTECWANVMPNLVVHSGHIHPLSTISGTFYVSVPKGASALKFEDPRLTQFMGSAPRVANARKQNQRFVSVPAKAGQVTLFESWMRHEVPPSRINKDRVSVSFNYNWF